MKRKLIEYHDNASHSQSILTHPGAVGNLLSHPGTVENLLPCPDTIRNSLPYPGAVENLSTHYHSSNANLNLAYKEKEKENENEKGKGNLKNEKESKLYNNLNLNTNDDSEVELEETKTEKKRGGKSKNKKVLKLEELTLRQLCLFNHSRRFLKQNKEIARTITQIINKKKPCSLRVLEHLITKYSRKYDIRLDIDGNDADFGDFCVADEYYKHLPKADADPCRRGDLIHYHHDGKTLETTIAQMCSVISICTTPSINYAKNNLLMIRKDLNRKKRIDTKKDTSHIPSPVKRERALYQIIPEVVRVEI